MSKFLQKVKDKSPEEIAQILEAEDELEAAHGAIAQEGQSHLEDIETPIKTHFICLT